MWFVNEHNTEVPEQEITTTKLHPMTVDEGKHLLRGPDPRQSLIERLWKRNSNSAMVRWINTNPEPRPRPPTLKMETQQQTQQLAVK